MSDNFKKITKSLLVFMVFALALKAGAYWMPPTATAPGNNTASALNVGSATQYKNGNFVAAGLKATVAGIFEGTLQIIPGAGVGKVLTSDVNGMATWQPAGGGGGGVVVGGDGSGTINYVTKFTGPSTIDDSQIFDNGTNVGIATASPTQKLDVNGNVKGTQFCLPGVNPTGGCISVWPSASGGGNGWTDDGTVVRLTTSTDKVGVGTVVPTGQLETTGNFKLPNSAQNGTAGIIFSSDTSGFEEDGRFIHNRGGANSTFVGERAGNLIYNQAGSGNTGVGFYNMIWGSPNGADNTGLGDHVLIGTNLASFNVAVGTSHVGGNSNNTNIGQDSLAYGFNAPCCTVTQDKNTAFGEGALRYDVPLDEPATRNYNTAAGSRSSGTNKLGTSNISLGYNAEFGGIDLTNAIAIGANAIANASNTMIFGNNSVHNWGFGVEPTGAIIRVGDDATNGNGATLANNGEWTQGSDRTKKHNILDISYGLNEVMKLRPVSFDWNGTNTHDIGFIAQEVKPIIPEIVSGAEGNYTMAYQNLTPALVKSLQELKLEHDEIERETAILEQELK